MQASASQYEGRGGGSVRKIVANLDGTFDLLTNLDYIALDSGKSVYWILVVPLVLIG